MRIVTDGHRDPLNLRDVLCAFHTGRERRECV
jgi:hypothetical protein